MLCTGLLGLSGHYNIQPNGIPNQFGYTFAFPSLSGQQFFFLQFQSPNMAFVVHLGPVVVRLYTVSWGPLLHQHSDDEYCIRP
jgi:hypothetical protein